MLQVAAASSEIAVGMLFLASYIFLLRVPSEALPICIGGVGEAVEQQSVVLVNESEVVLRLARRKNMPGGSTITRRCWCKDCALTCPVHVLGAFFKSCEPGSQPFVAIAAHQARSFLKTWLFGLGVADAHLYRPHDLRRGHARDLQVGGSTLVEILNAGQWRSPAFLA